ncbi:MAG TPA: ribosome small subunit-dependent GTPase A [Lysobacter sp.]|nr:ribosome small subunit-dependent GTPase A [Lysobacter sp.]
MTASSTPPPSGPDALGAIGWPLVEDAAGFEDWRRLMSAHPGARPARVVEQHRTGYIVADAPGTAFGVESLGDWLRPPGYREGRTDPTDRPGVGDWLLVEGDPKQAKAVALLPRRSAIKRGAAGEHYRQQLIAANVDVAFVVCGLDGDFNPRRIERYLLLVQGGGVEPVIALTKADLVDVEAAIEALRGVVGAEVAVFTVNAKHAPSVAQLDPWLAAGRTAVLVGSSGAGKSTLTNTLLGIERMKTGAVREHDSRGRHTTTHRTLIPLPQGGCLIDTPGMRELKPTGEEDVGDTFADIEQLAAQCRFRDCAHEKEPGCAVRAAVEGGALDPQRLANFRKLSDEVAGAANRLATRRQQKADAKVLTRALHKRLDEKHGRH